uniref:Ribonuclease A-domain domain-containing protein n=1 Tax=Stegastes partitus TaxID=144197 RepID=A0A3B5B2X1_9TELE
RTLKLESLLLFLQLTAALRVKLSWSRFKKKHIINNMTENDCNHVMKNRSIFVYVKRVRMCKPKNTFILAQPKEMVKSICKGQRNKKIRSKKGFHIVECVLFDGSNVFNCRYEGKHMEKKITVKCEGGSPVHYEGDI